MRARLNGRDPGGRSGSFPVGLRTRARCLLPAGQSLTLALFLPVALVSPGPWMDPAGAFPGGLQDSPPQSREDLLRPSGLDALAPRPRGSHGDPWSKSIERLMDNAKLEEARARLKKETALRGESHDLLFLEAKLLSREKRYYESLRLLQRCLALRQDDPRVYLLIASNGRLLNRNDIAKPALRSAIQLAPTDVLPRFHLGGLYYTESRFQMAAEELRAAIKLKPDFMPAHLVLGLALEELEDRDGALYSYRRAVELAESQKHRQDQPYLFLGRFLARLNRHNEGLLYLRKAVEINPDSSEALYLIGKILNVQGRDAEAIEALSKAIQSRPQYLDPHYMLSRIYQKLGRAEEAQQEFRVFQELKGQEKARDDGRRKRHENP